MLLRLKYLILFFLTGIASLHCSKKVSVNTSETLVFQEGYYLAIGENVSFHYPLIIIKKKPNLTLYHLSRLFYTHFSLGQSSTDPLAQTLSTATISDSLNKHTYAGLASPLNQEILIRSLILESPSNSNSGKELQSYRLKAITKEEAMSAFAKFISITDETHTKSTEEEQACIEAFGIACSQIH